MPIPRLLSLFIFLPHVTLFGVITLQVDYATDTAIGTGGLGPSSPWTTNTSDNTRITGFDLRGALNFINQQQIQRIPELTNGLQPPLPAYTIVFNSINPTILLSNVLPVINQYFSNTVIIDGANQGNRIMIDGNHLYRGLFARFGDIEIKNLTIQNTRAKGGDGARGGGGGLGAGAALFIDEAFVSLENVSLLNSTCIGGTGAMPFSDPFGNTGGGGGGLGGNGGTGGGGGLVGNGGNFSGGGGGSIGNGGDGIDLVMAGPANLAGAGGGGGGAIGCNGGNAGSNALGGIIRLFEGGGGGSSIQNISPPFPLTGAGSTFGSNIRAGQGGIPKSLMPGIGGAGGAPLLGTTFGAGGAGSNSSSLADPSPRAPGGGGFGGSNGNLNPSPTGSGGSGGNGLSVGGFGGGNGGIYVGYGIAGVGGGGGSETGGGGGGLGGGGGGSSKLGAGGGGGLGGGGGGGLNDVVVLTGILGGGGGVAGGGGGGSLIDPITVQSFSGAGGYLGGSGSSNFASNAGFGGGGGGCSGGFGGNGGFGGGGGGHNTMPFGSGGGGGFGGGGGTAALGGIGGAQSPSSVSQAGGGAALGGAIFINTSNIRGGLSGSPVFHDASSPFQGGVLTIKENVVIAGGSLTPGNSAAAAASGIFTTTGNLRLMPLFFDIPAGTSTTIQDSIGDDNIATIPLSNPNVIPGYLVGSTLLQKSGEGTLIFNGANTYSGNTIVTEGTLKVNNSLLANVIVQSGATLGGTGSILGNTKVYNGGVLRPGNSIGVITLNNLTLNPGAITYLEISPSAASQIAVTNGALLNNSVISLLQNPGNYGTSGSYTILTTGTGRVGMFNPKIEGGIAGYQFNLSYPNNYSVNLSYILQQLPTSSIPSYLIPMTTVLNHSAPSLTLSALYPYANSPSLLSVLDSISPTRLAQMRLSMINLSTDHFLPILSARMSLHRILVRPTGISKKPVAFDEDFLSDETDHVLADVSSLDDLLLTQTNKKLKFHNKTNSESTSSSKSSTETSSSRTSRRSKTLYSVWFDTFIGNTWQQSPTPPIPNLNGLNTGIAAGVDHITSHGMLGAFLGYAYSYFKNEHNFGNSHVNTIALAPYGTFNYRYFYLNASLLLGWNLVNSKREMLLLSMAAWGDYSMFQVIPHLELGLFWRKNQLLIEPYLALDAAYLWQSEIAEHGSLFAVTSPSDTASVLRSELGVRLSQYYTTTRAFWLFQETLAFVNKAVNNINQITSTFVSVPGNFTLDALFNNQNLFVGNFSCSYERGKYALMGRYQGEVGSSYFSNQVHVNFAHYF